MAKYKLPGWAVNCGLSVAAALALLQAAPVESNAENYTASERRHWSLQPRANPQIPQFDDAADRRWAQSPIDAFILARLKKDNLTPAPKADARTLVRRVYLDLTGLPPSPRQIAAFLSDHSPDAWSKLVDRLLASPEYGERWAQQWLDVVRFAESDGFEYDTHRSNAWEYRDYVIRSIQQDKPYNQFVEEQLAGDEIDPDNREMLVAASFNRLGPFRKNAGNQDTAYIRNEILTEMTNVVGSAFLGVTLGCARCHDHKFDPIRQKDYYRIQAFFATTQHREIPLATEAEKAEWQKKTDEMKAELSALKEKLKKLDGPEKAALERVIGEKEKLLPEPLPALSTVADDAKQNIPVHILTRGSSAAPGDKVGMRAMGVLLPYDAPELAAGIEKPRLHLAKWISDASNPLTYRVIVNRIWQGHFDRGIVATPNDFGRMGSRPAHPELLDYLANEFVAGGFRMKPVHRTILLSNAYQQAYVTDSEAQKAALDKDPEDRLLWRFPRHRLDAEQLRDTLLATSGLLNGKKAGPSVIVPIEPELVNLLYKPSQWAVNPDPREHARRSIYVFHKRNMRLPFLEVFDSPDAILSCARRESSTHAPQGLELLNGRLAQQASIALAGRLRHEVGASPSKQVNLAFALVYGRAPNRTERAASLRFLASSPLREFTLALYASNEFLYVK